MCPLVANIADRAVDAIPGEHFWSLTFLQYHLLCPFGRGCLIDPLICEFWRENDGPPVMYIDHSALGISRDDNEAMAFFLLSVQFRELADRCAEDGGTIGTLNEVGLLPCSSLVHPLEPAVDRGDRPVLPDCPVEARMGDFLGSGIDRCGTVLGPERSPTPSDELGYQILADQAKDGDLC